MNTVLSQTRRDDRDRLDDLTQLTRDTRVSLFDRASLRVGLWLLLRAERRARALPQRDDRARRELAVQTRARAEREAALVRAAITQQYR
ncbi:hypothetical protein ET475_14840 [Microbacterium protaetiae]|uniref:Uncharacterized protein n=1 Tax=Microbacterium protaetiae TaxID=2509458 RepID=A0A4P6EFH4_9MICO|nr:hypothetical protein [Microbacterium protaetiae]QAY61130.1 hypothetical protein ET475_14840 [Microbacterium protaetiae]